jgi:glycosyltransferase involved in cell wall biosynthesis
MYRILHVIDTLGIGGAENYVVSLVNKLNKEKFQVWIAYTDGRIQGIDGEALVSRLDRNVGLVKWNPKKIGSLRSLRYLPYNIYHVISLYKIIRQFDIHLVHTHLLFSAFRAWIAAKIACVPVIHNYTTIITPEVQTEWLLVKHKTLARFVDKFVNKYIAFSQSFMQDLRTKLKVNDSKIVLIYMGVDLALYNFCQTNKHFKEEMYLDERNPVVGVIARLYPEKGIYKVLNAWPYVVREIPEARLLVVGDGPLRHQLEEMTEALGISDSVIFAGVRHDIPEILNIIDIYVQTGDRPNLGLSALEAMAAGKPIITIVRNDEEREMAKENVIDGYNGFIVPNIPQEVASKIIWLIRNKKQANEMGQKSRILAEEKFNLEKHVKQVEELYESVIESKG